MLSFTDQTDRTIRLAKAPKRIISLVPSQTELLFELGLNEEVVGITKFCVHPQQWFHTKTRVGGTKQINLDTIHSLNPELILANKEENLKEQVEELAKHYPVWTSDINTLDDACEMIIQVGALTGKERNALLLVTKIRTKFNQLPKPNTEPGSVNLRPRTCYLIWQDPYMTVGGDTFIQAMLEAAGFENIFKHHKRYSELTIADLQNTNCELLLLSSEPFPFKQKHIDELQPLLPGTRILLVDGEMFSWYGSRLLESPGYFVRLRDKLVGR